jgi:hypothetical protein
MKKVPAGSLSYETTSAKGFMTLKNDISTGTAASTS